MFLKDCENYDLVLKKPLDDGSFEVILRHYRLIWYDGMHGRQLFLQRKNIADKKVQRSSLLKPHYLIAGRNNSYFTSTCDPLWEGVCPCKDTAQLDPPACVYDFQTDKAILWNYPAGEVPRSSVIFCNQFTWTNTKIWIEYEGSRICIIKDKKYDNVVLWDRKWNMNSKQCQRLNIGDSWNLPFTSTPSASTAKKPSTVETIIAQTLPKTLSSTTKLRTTKLPSTIAEPTTTVIRSTAEPITFPSSTAEPTTVTTTTTLEPTTVTTTTSESTTMTMTSVEPTTVTTSTAEPTTLTTTTAKPTTTAVPITLMTTTTAEPTTLMTTTSAELTTLISITTAVPTTATTTSSKPASVITTETATTTSNSRFSSIVSSARSLTTSEDVSLSTTLVSFSIEYTSEVPLSTVDGPTSRNHSVTASSSQIRSKRGSAFENQYYEFKLSPWPFVGMWTIACIALMCLLLACFVVGNKKEDRAEGSQDATVTSRKTNTTEPEV